MTRRVVGPFNRVEGDLEVRLDVEAGRVREAWVVSSLYRGFEQILLGKDPLDALVYAPRICGICSLSQSLAAAYALADAQGLEMPSNGRLALNLMSACENLADHITHFYLFFMPDFARDAYSREPWYGDVAARFKAVSGSAAAEMLPARARFLHVMGTLAGKWPHTLAAQPGGSTRAVEAREKVRLLAILAEFRTFLETRLFGDCLEHIAEMEGGDALERWTAMNRHNSSDFRFFLHLADRLELKMLGRAEDRFMSFGAYREEEGHFLSPGVWDGDFAALDPEQIREDISHSWLRGQDGPRHPRSGITLPDAVMADGYTWCKAPRLGGRTMEVGALARQTVDGHPLIRDLLTREGGNVRSRVIARLLETARLLPAMERWCRALEPKAPFCRQGEMPEEAEGAGLVEAARGSLGHWIRIRNGRLLNYQIVSPTTWNFSPRDQSGVPGPLETALAGTPVTDGPGDPVAVQHVVRSFDPCMVCTVH